MEQTADPALFASRDTYQQVAQQFDVEELGRIAIRGRRRRSGISCARTRTTGGNVDSATSRAQTPLIGRDWELRALEPSCRAGAAKGGGGIVCVVGRSGYGQRAACWAAQPGGAQTGSIIWYVTGSLSLHETGVPYAHFSVCCARRGVSPTDSAEAVRGKLTVFVDAFPADQQPQSDRSLNRCCCAAAQRQPPAGG